MPFGNSISSAANILKKHRTRRGPTSADAAERRAQNKKSRPSRGPVSADAAERRAESRDKAAKKMLGNLMDKIAEASQRRSAASGYGSVYQ